MHFMDQTSKIKKTLFFAESILKFLGFDANDFSIEYGEILEALMIGNSNYRLITYFFPKNRMALSGMRDVFKSRPVFRFLREYGLIDDHKIVDEHLKYEVPFKDLDDKLKFKIFEILFNCNSRFKVEWPFFRDKTGSNEVNFRRELIFSLPLKKKLENMLKNFGIYEQICINFDLISC